MSTKALSGLVPPPVCPNEVCSLELLERVQTDLGLTLPCDYVEFIRLYGSGCFARFYWVFIPFSVNKHLSLLPQVENLSAIETEFKSKWGDANVPYDVYPKNPGILPWACDDNGNYYYWLTEGDPDQWPIVQNEVRGSGYTQHPGCTMTSFLYRVLTGEIPALAGEYPTPEDMIFDVWRAGAD